MMNAVKRKVDYIQQYGSLLFLLILILVISVISPDFRTIDNLLSLLRQSSINGIIAFGMTCVILTGCIDLSVGSVLGLSTMICAVLIRSGVPIAIAMILALIAGTLLGTISGLFVAKGKLQPFIATLVTMTAFRSLTMILSSGKPVSISSGNSLLYVIGKGSFLSIPIPVWILTLSYAVFYFILKKTTFGKKIYATGSNSTAAALAGVNINRIKIWVYAISGFMASVSGLILLSRLGGSAQPVLGVGYELDAIAAVALGGTSMNGGRGRIFGTLVGVLIIAVLNNGLNILGVQSYFQDLTKALVILFAVLADRKK